MLHHRPRLGLLTTQTWLQSATKHWLTSSPRCVPKPVARERAMTLAARKPPRAVALRMSEEQREVVNIDPADGEMLLCA